LVFIFSVAAVEMTIRLNNISGVDQFDSAGQLIALLVSLALLVHVVIRAPW
jgi:hypothetical protein